MRCGYSVLRWQFRRCSAGGKSGATQGPDGIVEGHAPLHRPSIRRTNRAYSGSSEGRGKASPFDTAAAAARVEYEVKRA